MEATYKNIIHSWSKVQVVGGIYFICAKVSQSY